MQFEFSNLLGAPYRGGNVVLRDKELLSCAGNRVSVADLTAGTAKALPFEAPSTVRCVALSPNGQHLLVFDEGGKALFASLPRRVVLHRLSFEKPVNAAAFSPCGCFFAVATGPLVQVWRTPHPGKSFAPFALLRTYAGPYDTLTCLSWSADSRFVLAGGKDLTARLFSRAALKGYSPPVLGGHKDAIVGVSFVGRTAAGGAYTVSRDGALFEWDAGPDPSRGQESEEEEGEEEEGAGRAADRAAASAAAVWTLREKRFFMQNAKLTCVDFQLSPAGGLVVAGFAHGVFTLHSMPGFEPIHTLSVSRAPLTTATFGFDGAWVAIGSAKLGQLLVWEWRSETYVLKQQGHYFDVNTCAYSHDGALLVTGADDSKLKVWNVRQGSCFVTFKEHTAPVSAVAFLPNNSAVLSASLDGTVRAFDLVRYRNFRTFTSPEPTQFSTLAIDPAGEVVAAGCVDTFQVMTWNMKTGRLLDVLSGHESPISGLAFSPTASILASSGWDKTVRLWDVFSGKGTTEALPHQHDVLAVAFRPDGKQLVSATLEGNLTFWDPRESILMGSIEGRRDIAGGRSVYDRRTHANTSSGRCFTSVCYSSDGAFLLAGGASKYVCMYDAEEHVLLRRFQVSSNRQLDGVLDQLDSRRMHADAGPLDLLPDAEASDSDREEEEPMPGAGRASGAAGSSAAQGRKGARPAVRTKCVRISPTGTSFAAATTEGLLVYSQQSELAFDPTDLGEDVTPAAVHSALGRGKSSLALLLALRLNEAPLVRAVVERTPPDAVAASARAVPAARLRELLGTLAELAERSPHVEHVLRWCQALCVAHQRVIRDAAADFAPQLRALGKALARLHDDLSATAGGNAYALQYLVTAPQGAP